MSVNYKMILAARIWIQKEMKDIAGDAALSEKEALITFGIDGELFLYMKAQSKKHGQVWLEQFFQQVMGKQSD